MRLYGILLAIGFSVLSEGAQAQSTLWNHNGSVMRLEASGNARRFYYVEPRQGLPAKSGDMEFEGKRDGFIYAGRAFLFSANCGTIAYQVAGSVSTDENSVIMRGRAPRRDPQCNVVSYFDDELIFRLVPGASGSRTRTSDNDAASPAPGELTADAARSFAIKLLMGNPYGSTPSQVAQTIESQELKVDGDCGSNRRAWTFHIIVKPKPDIANGINGYLALDPYTGKMICAGLPFLD